jgi:hypothetical protein
MRLKFIFTPLIFVIAIIVSIWYIWPAISDIQLKQKEIGISKENLNSSLEKKKNSETLRGILDKNKDKEDFVGSFLPLSKSEERITDGISYLATDSGLNLINLSAVEGKESAPVAPVDNSLTAPVATDAALAPQNPAPQIKFMEVKATFSGNYESIKIFLGQLYKMEMLNEIDSLSISKAPAQSANGESVASDILIAEIGARFGYMNPVQGNGNSSFPIFSKNNFDFTPYSKIIDLITRKIPALDEGQKGKANPFLP